MNIGSASVLRRGHVTLALIVECIGLLAQFALVVLGFEYILFSEDDDDTEIGQLLLWCLLASVYLACTMLWLNIDLRLRDDDHPLVRKFIGGRLMRWFSTVVTFSTSLVGLSTAVTLIVLRSDPEHLMVYELVAVWAMLASWALFHWGFARIYHSRYFWATGDPPLLFPGTPDPRLLDFVYFSFTIGTSFAPSDVAVTQTRMRWTVLWHTVFSFFFNALIIVLTMNTIAGGLQGT